MKTIIAAILLGLCPLLANSQSILLEFSGTINEINDRPPLLNGGDPFSGFVVYTDTVADSNPDAYSGRYLDAIVDAEVSAGPWTATIQSTDDRYILVGNRSYTPPGGPPTDFIQFVTYTDSNLADNATVERIVFGFATGTTTATVFTDDSLPTSLNLEDFNLRQFSFIFSDSDTATGTITELTTTIIPDNPQQDVAIDIKPDSDSNVINPRKSGVIPVAVLGSAELDVVQIDVATALFGPSQAPAAHGGHYEYANGDAILDLLLHFSVPETGIVCGDEEATLTAETFAGDPVSGEDALRTVGCN